MREHEQNYLVLDEECQGAVLAYSGAMLHGGAYTIFKAKSGPALVQARFVQTLSNLLHLTHHSRYPSIRSAVAWMCNPLLPSFTLVLHPSQGRSCAHWCLQRHLELATSPHYSSHQLFWYQSCLCSYLDKNWIVLLQMSNGPSPVYFWTLISNILFFSEKLYSCLLI